MRAIFSLIIFAAACGDDSGAPGAFDLTAALSSDMSVTPTEDMSPLIERGPLDIPLGFEPGGLWWDAPTQMLYIATGSNQIVRWSDAAGLELYATIPLAFSPQSNNLGQLVRLSDGRIVVTVRGAGTNGNVLIVGTDTTTSAVPGLNQKRQRVGLALANDGTLFDGWFVGTGAGMPAGGISKLDLSSGETDVLLGLSQPFGVVVTASDLLVADQKLNAIFDMPLSNMDRDGGTTTQLATLTAPDLMTQGPNGDLFAGGPSVYRISSTGSVTNFATEMRNVRGVAYDADHTRLFVGDPDAKFNADAGTSAVLHILPVN